MQWAGQKVSPCKLTPFFALGCPDLCVYLGWLSCTVRRWQRNKLHVSPPTALHSTKACVTPSCEFKDDALLSCCRKRKSPYGQGKHAVVGFFFLFRALFLQNEPRVFFCLSDAFKCWASYMVTSWYSLYTITCHVTLFFCWFAWPKERSPPGFI